MYIKQVKDVLTLYGGLIILKVIMETKYQNLINYIQEQISDGQLGPGEKVPSENQLSEQFHISRQTVRKAIGTLEEDGLVQRIRGSGTYVSFDRRKNLEQRNSIAVVTTYVDSYIFPRILQGMQNTLFESGFSVQIYFTNNTLDREKSILKEEKIRKLNEGVQSAEKNVEKVKTYIETHFKEELTRESLASEVFMNPDYLSKLFKKNTGNSLMDYVTKVRIERAKELLERTVLPISEIAIETGYSNTAYFTKMFKKYTNGVTPREYRKGLGG